LYFEQIREEYSLAAVHLHPSVAEIHGRLGSLVFYTAGGTQRVRTHVVPANPRSNAQQAHRRRFSSAVSAWQSLSPCEKQCWNQRAALTRTSGYSLFISTTLKNGTLPGITRNPEHPDACIAPSATTTQTQSPSVSPFIRHKNPFILHKSFTDHHTRPPIPAPDTDTTKKFHFHQKNSPIFAARAL
jgi:hypothetical protein